MLTTWLKLLQCIPQLGVAVREVPTDPHLHFVLFDELRVLIQLFEFLSKELHEMGYFLGIAFVIFDTEGKYS